MKLGILTLILIVGAGGAFLVDQPIYAWGFMYCASVCIVVAITSIERVLENADKLVRSQEKVLVEEDTKA